MAGDENKFFKNINMKNLSFINFFTFYESLLDEIIHLNAYKLTGEYYELTPDKIKEICAKIKFLNSKIIKLKNKMKKESQFNKNIENNIILNNYKKEKERLLNYLNKHKIKK